MTDTLRLTTAEAASRLGVPERTVRRWLERYQERMFPRAFRSPGGMWRIDARDIAAIVDRRAERCGDSE